MIFNFEILRVPGRKPIQAVEVIDVFKRSRKTVVTADEKSGATVLARLPLGVQARVVAVDSASPAARRLIEMGVVPGAPVSVVKAAPLGDPIQIRVRGYHLALRREEARSITVDASYDSALPVLA